MFGFWTLFSVWNQNFKKSKWDKKNGFQTEKSCLKSEHLCLDFRHFFIYIPQITYCPLLFSELNVGVSIQNQKPVASHLEANGTHSNVQISDTVWNLNMLKSKRFVCVPKIPNVWNPMCWNPNWLLFRLRHCLKSERSISDIHFIGSI